MLLTLPTAMVHGCTYTVGAGSLAANGTTWTMKFDETTARSEAVHVNILGYVPTAPLKYAYVFHWMGDKGGLSLAAYAGKRFDLINQSNGVSAFNGTLTFDKAATNQETATASTRRRTATS